MDKSEQSLSPQEQDLNFQPNAKPKFSQRLAGGVIDLCFIFLFYWLCYFVVMNTPISATYKSYQNQITEIQDQTKLATGYGEAVYITEENANDYTGYLQYLDEEENVYVVVNVDNISEEVYANYVATLNADDEYGNLSFDRDFINYGINVLCGALSLGIFLLAVPLCNKRRATVGQLFAEEQLFSVRYEGKARWYHVLFRFLFIYIVEGCLPFLFLGLYAFIAMPLLFLIIASLTKSGRTLHGLISGTKVIDKKTFTPLVNDDEQEKDD